jgi:hypothetical protein
MTADQAQPRDTSAGLEELRKKLKEALEQADGLVGESVVAARIQEALDELERPR